MWTLEPITLGWFKIPTRLLLFPEPPGLEARASCVNCSSRECLPQEGCEGRLDPCVRAPWPGTSETPNTRGPGSFVVKSTTEPCLSSEPFMGWFGIAV